MSQLIDIILPTAYAKGQPLGRCRVRAYHTPAGVGVIFTELPDNDGPTVRDEIEILATDIRRSQMRRGEALYVFIHQPYDGQVVLDHTGDFELVQLTWDAQKRAYHTPRFMRVERARVQGLIGRALEEL